MTPEQIVKFKDTAAKLKILETRLALLQKNKEHLVMAGEANKIHVLVSVQARGTSQAIWLSDEEMQQLHLHLLRTVVEEINKVEEEIAHL